MLEYSDGIYAKVLYEFEIFLQVRYQFHFLMLFLLFVLKFLIPKLLLTTKLCLYYFLFFLEQF